MARELERQVWIAIEVIKKYGITIKAIEILTIVLFTFFENCFYLQHGAYDQIRGEVINLLYKFRNYRKITKYFLIIRFKKILQNLIINNLAIPRRDIPTGLLFDEENLDKILSKFLLQEETEEKFQEAIKLPRAKGVKFKAQMRELAIKRGTINSKPFLLKQQNLFASEEQVTNQFCN